MYRKISGKEKEFRKRIKEAETVLFSRKYSGDAPNNELEINLIIGEDNMEDGYYACEYNKREGFAEPMKEYEKPLLTLEESNDVNIPMSCNYCHVAYCC